MLATAEATGEGEPDMNEEFEIKNAIINSTKLGTGDRGFLDAWLYLDYGDSGGQGFGGFVLQVPKSFDHWKLEGVAGHFIMRVLEIAGVEYWDQLKGKTIRVKANHSSINAIGHIVKDDWFSPSEDFKKTTQETTK